MQPGHRPRSIHTSDHPASRRPTGSSPGSSAGIRRWPAGCRTLEAPESDRTIREMAAMLELTAALLRADSVAAVRSVVECVRALHAPLVGLLPDAPGPAGSLRPREGSAQARGHRAFVEA